MGDVRGGYGLHRLETFHVIDAVEQPLAGEGVAQKA
jgi:hypothetical protein